MTKTQPTTTKPCRKCNGTGKVAYGPDNGTCWACNPPAKRMRALVGDAYRTAALAAMEREEAEIWGRR